RFPRFRGAFSRSLPLRRRKSNVAAAVRLARTRASPGVASAAAAFDPSEYTRVRVNVQRTGANVNDPAWATAVTMSRKLRQPQVIVERKPETPPRRPWRYDLRTFQCAARTSRRRRR